MNRWMLLSLTSFMVASSGFADLVRGSQTLSVYGGFGASSTQYDYKPGDQRSVTGTSPAFGGQYLYYFSSVHALAVGADVISALGGNRSSGELLTGYESTARLRSLVGLAVVRLAYPRGELRPYIFAGLGAHHSTQQLSARPLAGNTWNDGGTDSRELIDERKTSVAVGYGIGLDLFPADRFFIGTELRGVWLAGLDTGDNQALRAQGFMADETRPVMQGYVLMHLGWKF